MGKVSSFSFKKGFYLNLFKKIKKIIFKVYKKQVNFYPILFEKVKVGSIELKNRFVMAPMTRSRAGQPGDVPTNLMKKYYSQRTSAGLIITEATQISLQGKGYALTPGIYTNDQIEGWKKITEVVHEKGSKIALQLWHVGRISHSQINGLKPLAPSAIKAKDTKTFIEKDTGLIEMVDVEQPKEMTQSDIDETINDFVKGAINAIKANFDLIEIHGANGYLIDQFLRSTSNQRKDEYGGFPEKRIKFLIDVTKAIIKELGADKVGIRLSPHVIFKDMQDDEIMETIFLAIQELEKLHVAYIHLCEADWDDAPTIDEEFRKKFRSYYSGKIIVTGKMTPKKGENLIKSKLVDLIGFGRYFISNPDYPIRVKTGAKLQEMKDEKFLFGGSEEGYTDYPLLNENK